MGNLCSSKGQKQLKIHKNDPKNTSSTNKNQQKENHFEMPYDEFRKINIEDGISYFLRRLDKFNQLDQNENGFGLVSFFEQQQRWLEKKLNCDIAFIIDLTTKNDKKRIRLFKELLADKERHQERFGIIYFGHNKAQFDFIDDSFETTYNLQQQLKQLKLDDWINIMKALKQHIVYHQDKKIPSLYVLSEHGDSENEESILELVENLLEDTCQKHTLNFHCHSYKIEDKDYLGSQDMSFCDDVSKQKKI